MPSRISYNFLIKFFYNFELCDHWIRLSFILVKMASSLAPIAEIIVCGPDGFYAIAILCRYWTCSFSGRSSKCRFVCIRRRGPIHGDGLSRIQTMYWAEVVCHFHLALSFITLYSCKNGFETWASIARLTIRKMSCPNGSRKLRFAQKIKRVVAQLKISQNLIKNLYGLIGLNGLFALSHPVLQVPEVRRERFS